MLVCLYFQVTSGQGSRERRLREQDMVQSVPIRPNSKQAYTFSLKTAQKVQDEKPASFRSQQPQETRTRTAFLCFQLFTASHKAAAHG